VATTFSQSVHRISLVVLRCRYTAGTLEVSSCFVHHNLGDGLW
jgi:hypothetical protein